MKNSRQSKTIRVSEATFQTAISIAHRLKIPLTEVFDCAIEALEREVFFAQMHTAYEKLSADGTLDEFKEEMAAWLRSPL